MFDALFHAAHAAVVHLSTLLAPVGGTAAAVVAVTMGVRLLVHPLTRAAVRGERARAALAPQLAVLRKKHGKDTTALAQAMTEMHREAGVSPLAGLLPMLLQMPVFIVLYQLFASATVAGQANVLLDSTLFGVPLSAHLVVPAAAWLPHLAVFGGVVAVLTALACVSSQRAVRLAALQETPPVGLLAALPRVLPYAILISAVVLPLAAVLYLVTSTAWTVAENALLRRGFPARAVAPLKASGGAVA
ncbi:protein translocase component YidC [Catellatospora methionotrophica]|uniref:Membrane protein insertase YidC n=1 Tax=Catellatospora methionotrophica TaxID=121620 RepID=A0A8J3LDN7_9ACTN|nr:YidC/Oxa1 family membrane protein insertase [Catellatospora methionotrophica]GIG16333.1 protein translocase component YidC [Catellatospora methionotrophica]